MNSFHILPTVIKIFNCLNSVALFHVRELGVEFKFSLINVVESVCLVEDDRLLTFCL